MGEFSRRWGVTVSVVLFSGHLAFAQPKPPAPVEPINNVRGSWSMDETTIELPAQTFVVSRRQGNYFFQGELSAQPRLTVSQRGDGRVMDVSLAMTARMVDERPLPDGFVWLDYRLARQAVEYPSQQVETLTVAFDAGEPATIKGSNGGRIAVPAGATTVTSITAVFANSNVPFRQEVVWGGDSLPGVLPWLIGGALLLGGGYTVARMKKPAAEEQEEEEEKEEGGVRIVTAPRFCLIDRDVAVEAVVDGAEGPVKWSVTPDGSVDGGRFIAASTPAEVTITASVDGAASSDSRTITVWNIRPQPEQKDRRIGVRESDAPNIWNEFTYYLDPSPTSLADLLESGELRLIEEEPADDTPAARYVFALTAGPSFENERMAKYAAFVDGALRWKGSLPAEEPDTEVAIVPGRHRLELVVRNGEHEATVTWRFHLDNQPSQLDLTGYWRVTDGAAKDWVMRGQSAGGGLVALHTAPGVVIGGQWSSDRVMTATVDLTSDGAPVPPFTGILDAEVKPPAVLTALLETRADRYPVLEGTPQGIPGAKLSITKELWSVEILQDRSTYWFDPASPTPERPSMRGYSGGAQARIRFERHPRPLIGAAGQGAAGIVEVRDGKGTSLGTLPAEIANRWVHGEVLWDGRNRETGELCPAGAYTLALTVRDGMAETTLTHKVLLGQGLRILSVPEHFAPGVDEVPIVFEWLPKETAPREVTLTVFDRHGTSLLTRTVPVTSSGDQFKTSWDGRGAALDPIDWPSLVPFTIELKATAAESGKELADRAQTTVEPVRLEIELQSPKEDPDAAAFANREVCADIDSLGVKVSVFVLDVSNREIAVTAGGSVRVSESVRSAAGERPAARKHGFRTAPVGSPETPLVVSLVDGGERLQYVPPSQAARYDYGQDREIEGDQFQLIAALSGWRGRTIGSNTEWYTIVSGRPTVFRQMSIDDIKAKFPDMARFNWEPRPLRTYVKTLASQGVSLFVDNPWLVKALEAALVNYSDYTMRYIGRVGNVRYRGFKDPGSSDALARSAGAHPERTDLDLYLAGYAGDDFNTLIGGQALLVIFEAIDRHGNGVALTAREDEGGLREPKAIIRIPKTAEADGAMPPFFLTTDGGNYVCDGRLIANAFGTGPASMMSAPGVFACYYVPGYPFPEIRDNEAKGELEKYMKAREFGSLQARLRDETDPRFRIFLTYRGERIELESPLRLCRAGTWRSIETPTTKWLRWAVAGDVSDVDTFKAEIAVSIIPVIGDGRDLAIYALKNAFGSELSKFDHFFAGVALIGLILDAGDFTIVGIVPNGVVAIFKSAGKYIVSTGRGAAKIGTAFLEVFDPLVDAARRLGPSEPAKLAAEVQKAGPFIELSAKAVRDGMFERRMQQIAAIVDKCNPKTCLLPFCTLGPEISEHLLGRHYDDAMRLIDVFKRFGVRNLDDAARADNARDAFRKIMELSERLIHSADAAGAASPRAFSNLVDIIAKADNPASVIDELHAIAPSALRAAGPALATQGFREAALLEKSVLPAIVRQLRAHGDDAADVLKKATTDGAETFHRIAAVFDSIDNAVPRLRTLTSSPHFDTLNGRHGLAFALEAVDGLLKNNARAAAEQTMKILEDLPKQFGPGGPLSDAGRMVTQPILFESVHTAFKNLGPERFGIYAESIGFFRRNGELPPGILTPANANATANFLTVAQNPSKAADFALEIVGTRSLIESGRPINLASGGTGAARTVSGLPSEILLTKDSIVAFGFKGPTPTGTIEADVLVNFQGRTLYVDWKNYLAEALPKKSDVDKAVAALQNRTGPAVQNVIFLSRNTWDHAAKARFDELALNVPQGKALLLGWVLPDGPLARFLR
jgi:hypothetical protein